MPLNPGVYNGDGTVVAQESYGPGCWKMTIELPSKAPIAAGQFCHVNCGDGPDPLLRRPFSYWDVRPGRKGTTHADILYTVVGKGTKALARMKPGSTLGYLGPVGRGFTFRKDLRDWIFVAGGVGIVPFYLFAKQAKKAGLKPRMSLIFGARNKAMLWGIDEFKKLGVSIHAATDDGSRGRKGLVTELLVEQLDALDPARTMLYTCGPDRMLDAVAKIALARKLPCEVSMERRMGCALGACGACVTPVKDGKDWRYSRICWEGPTYDVNDLVLEQR